MQLIRLAYFLIFDLLCSYSKIYGTKPDTTNRKAKYINDILENQRSIKQELAAIYREERGGNLKEEKKPHLKEWNQERTKVVTKLGMSVNALKQGKTYEQVMAIQNQQASAAATAGPKLKRFGMICFFGYLAYKQFVK